MSHSLIGGTKKYGWPVTGWKESFHVLWPACKRGGGVVVVGGGGSGGGGFFLACEDFGRMFDHSFPACTFFSFFF